MDRTIAKGSDIPGCVTGVCLEVAPGTTRARYLAGEATPEASLTGQIAKRRRARQGPVRARLEVAPGTARARYLAGEATPEASLTGQIAKRCRARTKHGQGASR
ncbi:hypothetical protein GCM10010191_24040 [Actinomadura vinacea]|uniref:Uncharacterized protein n=1 Tax=Actinomadura vinacea TaxID=115336 RepID=A0ABN3ITH8_9ACTN